MRIENARSATQLEAAKGRLDDYVGLLQRRLKSATTEDEARDLVWRLVFAYVHKGQGAKMKELLQSDVANIANAELRQQLTDEPTRIHKWLAMPKPWRKDRDK
jgi:hypothetical protein